MSRYRRRSRLWLPDRRQVLKAGLLGSATLIGCAGGEAPHDLERDGGSNPDAGSKAWADAGESTPDAGMMDAGASCELTGSDILGPKYREGAPYRYQIADPSEPGERFFVNGRVQDRSCVALAGAVVEVWQADDTGIYDDTSPEFRLRGRAAIDASGEYGFETILPGVYLGRPRHLHFMVRYELNGQPAEFITQLYFEGDPNLANEPPSNADRAIAPVQRQDGLHGVFDLTLDA